LSLCSGAERGAKSRGQGWRFGQGSGEEGALYPLQFYTGKNIHIFKIKVLKRRFFDDSRTNEVLSPLQFLNNTYPFSDFKIFFDKILRNFGNTTSQMNISQIWNRFLEEIFLVLMSPS